MLAIDAKFWGVVVMGGAVIILFFLPWLDNSAAKSIRYRPTWHSWMYGIFVVNFLVLGYLGMQVTTPVKTILARVFTIIYFMFFLLMPLYTSTDNDKPVPDRVRYP